MISFSFEIKTVIESMLSVKIDDINSSVNNKIMCPLRCIFVLNGI
jgi:hypothetical protein